MSAERNVRLNSAAFLKLIKLPCVLEVGLRLCTGLTGQGLKNLPGLAVA